MWCIVSSRTWSAAARPHFGAVTAPQAAAEGPKDGSHTLDCTGRCSSVRAIFSGDGRWRPRPSQGRGASRAGRRRRASRGSLWAAHPTSHSPRAHHTTAPLPWCPPPAIRPGRSLGGGSIPCSQPAASAPHPWVLYRARSRLRRATRLPAHDGPACGIFLTSVAPDRTHYISLLSPAAHALGAAGSPCMCSAQHRCARPGSPPPGHCLFFPQCVPPSLAVAATRSWP